MLRVVIIMRKVMKREINPNAFMILNEIFAFGQIFASNFFSFYLAPIIQRRINFKLGYLNEKLMLMIPVENSQLCFLSSKFSFCISTV